VKLAGTKSFKKQTGNNKFQFESLKILTETTFSGTGDAITRPWKWLSRGGC
jgi:hypothetical protein